MRPPKEARDRIFPGSRKVCVCGWFHLTCHRWKKIQNPFLKSRNLNFKMGGFFLRLFTYSLEREREGGGETAEGRSRLPH